MQIGTAVFERIVSEARQHERAAAVKAVCQTMSETVRFGCLTPDVLVPLAENRIDSWKQEKGW